MIKAEDEIILDLSTSCTKEVAAAKLLGWMKGSRRLKVIEVTENGISGEHLPYYSMEDSLLEQLHELREAARQRLIYAAENDATFEELEEKDQAVVNADALIEKASIYLSDIDLELAKGDESIIKVDHKKTNTTGVEHVYLSSLDKWAKQQYKLSIYDDLDGDNNSYKILPTTTSNEQEIEVTPKGGLSRTKTKHLYTTFGLLMEAFAKLAPKFGGDNPTVDSIAKEIEKLATNSKTGEILTGLKAEAIKDRIEDAQKILNSRRDQNWK